MLPEDLVIEILVLLPVKSIQRFKCVSKSWNHLIRSSMFINTHQKRDRKQSVLLLKRYLRLQDGGRKVFSFHDPDFPQVVVSPDLSIPILDYFKYHNIPTTILGPCNGLVCVTLGEEIVLLCNPALRQFRSLPPRNIVYPEGYLAFNFETGFGFDPNTGAYKVVQFHQIEHINGRHFGDRSEYPLHCTMRIDLYNSTSNSWKQIDPELPIETVCPRFQLFFNKVIHLSGTLENQKWQFILCFDVSTEAFRLMDYPIDDLDEIYRSFENLMVLKESLAMVVHQEQGAQLIDIWVMNEYGLRESWTKQFVIGPYYVVRSLLCLRDEWLLCESKNGQLAACALHEYQFKEFQVYGRVLSLTAMVYEESLISLDTLIPGEAGMHD